MEAVLRTCCRAQDVIWQAGDLGRTKRVQGTRGLEGPIGLIGPIRRRVRKVVHFVGGMCINGACRRTAGEA